MGCYTLAGTKHVTPDNRRTCRCIIITESYGHVSVIFYAAYHTTTINVTAIRLATYGTVAYVNECAAGALVNNSHHSFVTLIVVSNTLTAAIHVTAYGYLPVIGGCSLILGLTVLQCAYLHIGVTLDVGQVTAAKHITVNLGSTTCHLSVNRSMAGPRSYPLACANLHMGVTYNVGFISTAVDSIDCTYCQ